MERSSYLDPNGIKAQCTSAVQILQKDNEALQEAGNSLEVFVSDRELKSSSFDMLKQQISDYRNIIRAMKAANDSDITDYETLKGAVGSEVLDGAVILEQKENAEVSRKNNESQALFYRGSVLWGGAVSPLVSSYYQKMAVHYDRLAEISRQLYERWQEKEVKYDTIENGTRRLFGASRGLRAAIHAGISDISGAFRCGAYVPNRNAAWRTVVEDPAKELRICRQLLGKGVTAEQIQNMEELGYTAGQILAALDMCETTEDRQFFGYLMDGTKQAYGQAFAIDPDQLSDGMILLMADYACHLVPFDPDGSCLSGTDRLM